MKVATHDGSFHADDAFAIAALRLAHPDLTVVRTRDRSLLDECDLRVDVGRVNDPATGDYDHHQPGGAGARPNGIPYAAFGLIWSRFGRELCGGDARAAGLVDEQLVQGVDANDTGTTLHRAVIEHAQVMTVSEVIGDLNFSWDEDPSPEQVHARFMEAVTLAQGILERLIASTLARTRAYEAVRAAIDRAPDPRVIELDRSMPFHEPIHDHAPDALYVVFPRKAEWALEAVPSVPGQFGNRRDLPAAWAGLTGPALQQVTGVPDAVFCHLALFFAVAGSRDGIYALARQALAAT